MGDEAHIALILRSDLVFRSKMSDAAADNLEVRLKERWRVGQAADPLECACRSASRALLDLDEIAELVSGIDVYDFSASTSSLHVVGLPFERRLCVQLVFSVRILDRTIH
ncbi:hypothetical protein [Actinomycetospora sp. CA-053990]|uniref:hypothetical protein n=1 Tax=Actinomycetospora sp. CA-053990 TaxID=3239891 RepID=UPI003D916D16